MQVIRQQAFVAGTVKGSAEPRSHARMNAESTDSNNSTPSAADFVRDLVRADIAAGTNGSAVQTRFPPEPNGYQIGRAHV